MDTCTLTGQTNPYNGFQQQLQMFFNIGMYLQAPNGLNSITSYEIDSSSSNWTGLIVFNSGAGQNVTPNFPQQDSTAISYDYPAQTQAGLNPSAGNSADWGICGGSGILAFNFLGSPYIEMLPLVDLRARQGNPTAGQVLTIRYKAVAVNGAGATETCFHTIEITLT